MSRYSLKRKLRNPGSPTRSASNVRVICQHILSLMSKRLHCKQIASRRNRLASARGLQPRSSRYEIGKCYFISQAQSTSSKCYRTFVKLALILARQSDCFRRSFKQDKEYVMP